jgi:hypothetical protein
MLIHQPMNFNKIINHNGTTLDLYVFLQLLPFIQKFSFNKMYHITHYTIITITRTVTKKNSNKNSKRTEIRYYQTKKKI